MPAPTAANVLAYLLQVAVIAGLGLIGARWVRLHSPRAWYYLWRGLLVASLGLPLTVAVSGARVSSPLVSVAPLARRAGVEGGAEGGVAAPAGRHEDEGPWQSRSGQLAGLALGVVAGGVVVRIGWLALGLAGLRRLRRSASAPSSRPQAIDEAAGLVGVDADVRFSPDVSDPVTFGAWRPTVLLPHHFHRLQATEQRAIACHELLHVKRLDWLSALGDELLKSVFWFHPGIRSILARISLAREQVVDRDVVRLLHERVPYLRALVELASVVQPRPTPVLALSMSRDLKTRIALLRKPETPGGWKAPVSAAAFCFTMLLCAGLGAAVLPLEVPGELTPAAGDEEPATGTSSTSPSATGTQAQQDSNTAPRGKPGFPTLPAPPPAARLRAPVEPEYPSEALAAGKGGFVAVRAELDANGRPSSVTIADGSTAPALCGEAAAAATRQAVFELPAGATRVALLGFRFDPVLRRAKMIEPPPPPPSLLSLPQRIIAARRYPAAARAIGFEGTVVVAAQLDAMGNVTAAELAHGPASLATAAIDEVLAARPIPPPRAPYLLGIGVNFQR